MHAQLIRLADAARQTNVTLQVLPFSVGAHIAMLGTFVLLSFPEPSDPDVVYLAALPLRAGVIPVSVGLVEAVSGPCLLHVCSSVRM